MFSARGFPQGLQENLNTVQKWVCSRECVRVYVCVCVLSDLKPVVKQVEKIL